MEIVGQYLVIMFAVAALIGLKYYVINRRVKKQIDVYIDPGQCIK